MSILANIANAECRDRTPVSALPVFYWCTSMTTSNQNIWATDAGASERLQNARLSWVQLLGSPQVQHKFNRQRKEKSVDFS